jgi:hypothetical protein
MRLAEPNLRGLTLVENVQTDTRSLYERVPSAIHPPIDADSTFYQRRIIH